jgi:hypothetical protein
MPITRRNNCVYATLGTCYSVWMTVWCAVWTMYRFININILRIIVNQVGFTYKIVFVVYIKFAFVVVMNEQCNYIILDKLASHLKLVADRSSHSEHRALQI